MAKVQHVSNRTQSVFGRKAAMNLADRVDPVVCVVAGEGGAL